MQKHLLRALCGSLVCVGLALATFSPAGYAAGIKEVVVKAGNYDRSNCPVHVVSETPIAPGDMKSLKAPDGKLIPVQVRKLTKSSVLTFIPPKMAARQTLHLTPSKDEAPVDKVVLRNAGQAKIDIEVGGSLLTSFCYPAKTEKPYLYPVIGPKGTRLTRGYPMETIDYEEGARDHPHHRSLYVAHGDVNGANFWHISKDPGKQDAQKVEEIDVMASGPVYGRLVAQINWNHGDGSLVVEEEREYVFYNTPDNCRVIDTISTFKATDGDVTFGDTKEGGLCSLRLNPKIDESHGNGVMRNSAGGKGAGECWGERAAWCDYYGTLKDTVVGVAVFDHPTNLRHPTWWHIRDYGLYTANCFGLHNFEGLDDVHKGDYTLPAGKTLAFQYRIILHEGDTEQAKIDEHYAGFAGQPPKATIVWE